MLITRLTPGQSR